MNAPKFRFVIWGYGSENVFQDFANYLKSLSYDVLILPSLDLDKYAELEQLTQAPYVLLTSSHFTRGKKTLSEIYPDINIHTEFLEILHHCPPVLSVFYPHDLSTPLVINEPHQLAAFDLVLWPTSYFGYQPRPRKIVDVGWIGFKKSYLPPISRCYDSVFLFSDVCHHMATLGINGTYEKLAHILKCGTAIKFPNWPGHEDFEEYFSSRGVTVIPAATTAGDVILDSRVIVSNSVSSISIEAAYMGTPVINLVEDYWPKEMQREFLSGIPGCVQSSYADFQRHLAAPPISTHPMVKSFDHESVLKTILAEAEKNPAKTIAVKSKLAQTRAVKITLLNLAPATVEEYTAFDEPSHSPPDRQTQSPCDSQKTDINAPFPLLKDSKPDIDADAIEFATALRLLELGDEERAFSILQDLVNTFTTLPGPYHQIGILAQKQNEADIAHEFLTMACERESPPGAAHRALAELHFSAGRHQETLNILSVLLRNAPTPDWDALDLLRRTLGQMPALDSISWARLIAALRFKLN